VGLLHGPPLGTAPFSRAFEELANRAEGPSAETAPELGGPFDGGHCQSQMIGRDDIPAAPGPRPRTSQMAPSSRPDVALLLLSSQGTRAYLSECVALD
jgi:hypothetical protein